MKLNRKQKSASSAMTHEGARAAKLTPTQALRRSVMANMLWEDTFYEDGASVVDRIRGLIDHVPTPNLVDIAVGARTDMKLRHVPLLLAREMARSPSIAHRHQVSKLLPQIIQRPDELTEFLAIYWKDGKQPLSAQVKKGLATAFRKFNEYSLAKYNRKDAVRLRDVLFLSHSNPNEAPSGRYTKDERRLERETGNLWQLNDKEQLYQRVVDDKLVTPDTWEVNLSAGADKKETFTRLMAEGKLGALAYLRNLRNMTEAGISLTKIRTYAKTLNVERVLPFRFVAAARIVPALEPTLEELMFKCLEGSPKLSGKTALIVDNSGSMYFEKVSARSEMTRSDAACALAILLREICEDCVVIGFASSAEIIAPRRGFALRDAIQNGPKGGTNTDLAIKLAAKEGYDRIIVVTDEQSHTNIPGPLAGTNAYFINVATYQHGIGYNKWVHIDGWSEAIIDYLREFEAAFN